MGLIMSTAAEGKKSGCVKYCAIGCAVVLVLAVVGGFIAYRGVKGYVSTMVTQYAATEPQKLPTVECTEQEVADVVARIEDFTGNLKADRPAPELSLTSKDVNMLIEKYPKLKDVAGKAHIEIEGDKIGGDVSVPLDQLGEMFKGRYLNGSATFRVEMSAGRLMMFIDSLNIKGQPLPDDFMRTLKMKNLAEEACKNPDFAAMVDKLESITVRDGTIMVTPKKK